ncbi:MAG: hypothetical protein MI741_05845, partial [Rhodospirillales bacterium]|nr:hypothetical protein [Rhodospirillales bacterium]
KHLPIGHWMHRSCVPLIRPVDFDEIHWATLKPIIENLWAAGHQTLFYAEGNWNAHLEAFCELPASSIVYQVDRDDIEDVHKRIGHKFCVCGGVPNTMLAYGTPDEVRAQCKKVIEAVAGDGGFIMDAAAIVQNDAKEENIAAMIEATREFGVYRDEPSDEPPRLPAPKNGFVPTDMTAWHTARKPGVCVPWSQKVEELAPIEGHPDLIERVWNDIESFGYNFIWHILVSF